MALNFWHIPLCARITSMGCYYSRFCAFLGLNLGLCVCRARTLLICNNFKQTISWSWLNSSRTQQVVSKVSSVWASAKYVRRLLLDRWTNGETRLFLTVMFTSRTGWASTGDNHFHCLRQQTLEWPASRWGAAYADQPLGCSLSIQALRKDEPESQAKVLSFSAIPERSQGSRVWWNLENPGWQHHTSSSFGLDC